MILERFIKFVQRKGYNEFYAADLADSYDYYIWFFGGAIQFILYIIIGAVLESVWPDTFDISFLKMFIKCWQTTLFVILIGTIIPYFNIRMNQKKGDIEHQRIHYMIGSAVSSSFLFVLRYMPLIAIGFQLYNFLVRGFGKGFQGDFLIGFGIDFVVLFLLSFIYHKLLSFMMKEARYYVDWKITQTVGHFDESVSRSEKWIRSSADLDFEKQDIYRYRKLQVAAFVGAFISTFSALVFTIGFIPSEELFNLTPAEQIKQTANLKEETNTYKKENRTSNKNSMPKNDNIDVNNDENTFNSEETFEEYIEENDDNYNETSEGYETILSERKISTSDLSHKSKKELEIMRNSIYARYGYIFNREDLYDYFSQFSWYNPYTSDMSEIYNQMSSVEQYNVKFIKEFETRASSIQ